MAVFDHQLYLVVLSKLNQRCEYPFKFIKVAQKVFGDIPANKGSHQLGSQHLSGQNDLLQVAIDLGTVRGSQSKLLSL